MHSHLTSVPFTFSALEQFYSKESSLISVVLFLPLYLSFSVITISTFQFHYLLKLFLSPMTTMMINALVNIYFHIINLINAVCERVDPFSLEIFFPFGFWDVTASWFPTLPSGLSSLLITLLLILTMMFWSSDFGILFI